MDVSKYLPAVELPTDIVSFLMVHPLAYIKIAWKVYDIFLRKKLKRKFSELEVEHIDKELVRLREERARLGFEYRERRKLTADAGATAALDAATTADALGDTMRKLIDAEYEIRYLCLLRRFFVRMGKYDRERWISHIKKLDALEVNEEMVSRMIKAQPGLIRKGEMAEMVKAWADLQVSEIQKKHQIIDMLCQVEGTALSSYTLEEIERDVGKVLEG
ncbi:MAG: hypothetical protein AB1665_03605 [Candidatus Thermoplasmatota archaeon]